MAGLLLAGAIAFAIVFSGERLVLGLCGLICDHQVAIHPAVRPHVAPVVVTGVVWALVLMVAAARHPKA